MRVTSETTFTFNWAAARGNVFLLTVEWAAITWENFGAIEAIRSACGSARLWANFSSEQVITFSIPGYLAMVAAQEVTSFAVPATKQVIGNPSF